MMIKLINAVWAGVKAYPHGVALVLNLGVILVAKFGFEVTPDQLVTIVAATSIAVTAYTHKTMVPKSSAPGKLSSAFAR